MNILGFGFIVFKGDVLMLKFIVKWFCSFFNNFIMIGFVVI